MIIVNVLLDIGIGRNKFFLIQEGRETAAPSPFRILSCLAIVY